MTQAVRQVLQLATATSGDGGEALSIYVCSSEYNGGSPERRFCFSHRHQLAAFRSLHPSTLWRCPGFFERQVGQNAL